MNQDKIDRRLRRIEDDDEFASKVGEKIAEVMQLKRSKIHPDRWVLGAGHLSKTSAGLARTAKRLVLED